MEIDEMSKEDESAGSWICQQGRESHESHDGLFLLCLKYSSYLPPETVTALSTS